jgi:hypothetical protein
LGPFGDDEATTTTASAPCGPDDLGRGAISSSEVEVISNERARKTFVVTGKVEVGVVGFHRLLGPLLGNLNQGDPVDTTDWVTPV